MKNEQKNKEIKFILSLDILNNLTNLSKKLQNFISSFNNIFLLKINIIKARINNFYFCIII